MAYSHCTPRALPRDVLHQPSGRVRSNLLFRGKFGGDCHAADAARKDDPFRLCVRDDDLPGGSQAGLEGVCAGPLEDGGHVVLHTGLDHGLDSGEIGNDHLPAIDPHHLLFLELREQAADGLDGQAQVVPDILA